MASNLKGVIAQVKTQIASANGSGVYTYDLSADGSVVRGAVLDPPVSSPCVGIFHETTTTEPGARLGYFERTTSIGVHGWVSHDGTEGDAEDAAADLFNDILRGVESDRTLAGKARDVKADGTFFGGGMIGFDGWGIVALDLTVNWSQETGA